MRIAINTRLLVPGKMDGIARFTYETLDYLSKKNPNVEFTFIFDRKIDLNQFDFANNVRIVSLSPQARHPFLWIIWFEFVLRRYINRQKFDIFISPEGWIPSGLRCKSLGVVHDLNFEHHPENIVFSHRIYLKYFFPRFVKRAHRLATVSEFSKKDLVETYQINPTKIDVVFNGVNSIFRPLGQSDKHQVQSKYADGHEYFIFIGTIHPRKNLEHLFKAFSLFKEKTQSHIKLLIVGNKKWWPKQLEKAYQTSYAKRDIRFLGRIDDKELARILGAATCLTYIPYFEGFGIPILEAFQSQVPVITSNVSSLPEVAGKAAIFCHPESTEEIADAMHEIYTDESKRNELIEAGKLQVMNYSWDKSATLLWKTIQDTYKQK